MRLIHADLIQAISDYGVAQHNFGKSGGYVKMDDMPFCQPADAELQQAAGEQWARVLALLDWHFSRNWFVRLLNWLRVEWGETPAPLELRSRKIT